MKPQKAITIFLFTVLLASIVTAAVSFTISPTSLSFDLGSTQKTLTITNDGNESSFTIPSEVTGSYEIDGNTETITYTITSEDSYNNVPNGGTIDLSFSLTGNLEVFNYGSYPDEFEIVADDGNETKTVGLTFNRGFCDVGEQATNNISISDIDVNSKGDSDDSEDDVWILGDEVEIKVDVENLMDDEKLSDIIVEMGLFDSEGRNFADDLVFDSSSSDDEKDDRGSIKKDDEETAVFNFRVPPDFDVDNYRLVFKAYDDGDEESLCVEDEFGTIDVDQESDEGRFVIVDEIQMSEQVTCGETVSGSFTVYNIGDSDQEKVRITMKNTELGLDEFFEIEDLDEGDDDTVSFTFIMPSEAKNGPQTIDFRTRYEYDDGVYDEISDNTFFGFTTVLGCFEPDTDTTPPTTGPQVIVSAELDSQPRAGEQLVVSSVITNAGSDLATILVDVTAFESWATLDSISQRTLTLDAGQSRTVVFTFNVNEDVAGSQSFVVETNTGNNIGIQEVEVSFPQESTGGFDFSFGDNNLIWVIAVVNIILIVLIILVAVRLSRR